ncbi:MAG: hypothetical protein NTY77_06870 [Elusimicrobia bacterium]|nr:hypothetical protein [Elusimicrobiota bacterium]
MLEYRGSSVGAMRFYFLVGSAVRGPLTVELIRSWPGISPETPVCPEDRDHRKADNWRAAASYPQLLARPAAAPAEPDGGASPFWRSAAAKGLAARALAAAQAQETGRGEGGVGWARPSALLLPALALALLAFALRHRGRPESRPAPPRSSGPSTLMDQAAPLFLPAGLLPRDEAQSLRRCAWSIVIDGRPQIIVPADGRNLKVDARFSYDPKRRELRPANEAARGLLDIRRGHLNP